MERSFTKMIFLNLDYLEQIKFYFCGGSDPSVCL